MYHSRSGVERLVSEGHAIGNATSLTNDITASRKSTGFTGLEYYNSVFGSSVATTSELKNNCFRIRFQVYCIDNEFEDPANNPDGFERDSFDGHSVHSLLTHRATGNAIGTVRLVLPQDGGERRVLPMQRIAGAIAADSVAPFPVYRTAEISRFSIVKSFRQHVPETGVEATLSPEEWRKMLFHLPLGLIKSCVEMSVREGITHWAAVMEPALLRLLTRLGIHFNPLGSLVDYHGRRQPCWADLGALLRRVHAERPDVWEIITDGGRLWPLDETSPAEAVAVTAPSRSACLAVAN
ncbi:PEP-CTERM/exosortase system-associated acyltransferase [Skermanella pratensis]|uniref:PEP-CTERM/exosortase system-associated acyltransferase n=1 Tax=Skermanella pratensis TaxID=2233999 RepID=UPI001787A35F|nr:PEP-CTERM/exosortase system-associated acyltransferase [Skermanella pratensis]